MTVSRYHGFGAEEAKWAGRGKGKGKGKGKGRGAECGGDYIRIEYFPVFVR